MKSGKRTWADGTLVAGQQFEYGFDDIGNRSSAKTGGDALGANLRSQGYTVNDLNLYTARTKPRYLEVQGAAQTTATVQVDGSTSGVLRQGEYFRRELGSIAGTGPAWQTVTVGLSGGTNTGTKRLFLPPATESYTHDADGNLTDDGRWEAYVWDGENRLVEMRRDTASPAQAKQKLTFEYDHLGRRIRKVYYDHTGAKKRDTTYLFDGWNMVVEADANNANATLRTYVWGTDLSGSRTGAGGVGGLLWVNNVQSGLIAGIQFAAYDGNDNVTGLFAASDGSNTARYEYGPFGEPLRLTGTLAKANPVRWSTKVTDDEGGLVYYGYRYYNPSMGRWLSRDPIGERGGLNRYGFVNNQPSIAVDLLGLDQYKVICSAANELDNRIDTLRAANPDDARLGFLQIQECILRKLCFGSCCADPRRAEWLNRVIGTFMGQLFDALDRKIYLANSRWTETFGLVRAGQAIGFAVDKITDEEGGNFIDGVVHYTVYTAADRKMALTHINQDLQRALLTHGYGFDDDWKCIGGVVSDCMRTHYNWFERRLARNFDNPWFPTDIPRIRDDMRNRLRKRNPNLPPIVEEP